MHCRRYRLFFPTDRRCLFGNLRGPLSAHASGVGLYAFQSPFASKRDRRRVLPPSVLGIYTAPVMMSVMNFANWLISRGRLGVLAMPGRQHDRPSIGMAVKFKLRHYRLGGIRVATGIVAGRAHHVCTPSNASIGSRLFGVPGRAG